VTVDAVDLLRRLLREGPVYVDERYRVLTDSEGYRELTVTDEEFAYCQRLASEEEGT
jgi:hypothetical protein